jgi:hypothetical protein
LLNSLNCSLIGLAQLIEDVIIDRLVEYIDLGGSELSSADTLLEQNTQLGKGSAIGLGQAEVGIDDAEEADTTLLITLAWQLSEETLQDLPRRNRCSCSSSRQWG